MSCIDQASLAPKCQMVCRGWSTLMVNVPPAHAVKTAVWTANNVIIVFFIIVK